MGLIDYQEIEPTDAVTPNIFNERFGQIVALLNGGLGADNFAAGGIPASALATSVFQAVYPVGSLYYNATNDTNPATLLGFGTWAAFATGRVVAGYDASQTEFNAAEKTGGHKELQSHGHNGTTNAGGNHNHTVPFHGATSSVTPGSDLKGINWPSNSSKTTSDAGNHTHTFTTDNAGTGDSGNLQPFITVYVWKRVS